MLTQHPLSAAFPAMSPLDLAALTDDVAQHGLRQPIIIYEGQVLDGWHRYSACVAAGVAHRAVELPDDEDPVAYVLSLNLSRRHLSASQRAAAVVACAEWKPVGNPTLKPNAATLPLSTVAEMAASADVSPRTIRDAKAAQRAGRGQEVRDGRLSASAAAGRAPRKAASEDRSEYNHGDEPEMPPVDTAHSEAIDDMVLELQSLRRIVESNDKTAEAWAEAKTATAKLADMGRMYDAKCAELATMTREAKRWRRKCEQFERGELK